MINFEKRLDEYIIAIENALFSYLDYLKEDPQSVVSEAMCYSTSAGGKRIRPVLMLEFCRVFGGNTEQVMGFACALEMIHTYSLIHDDLPCMDNDDFRRGKPSCHKQFGEANALLAGDGLLTKAFEVAASSPELGLSAEKTVKGMLLLAKHAGINGMIGGQVIDLSSEGKTISGELLTQMHSLKTGALIKAACEIGALSALGSIPDFVTTYAENLGLAFQAVDDILDVKGTAEELGKPIGSDLNSQKSTYVSLYGLQTAVQKAEAFTDLAKSALQMVPQNEFLVNLTDHLLKRTH